MYVCILINTYIYICIYLFFYIFIYLYLFFEVSYVPGSHSLCTLIMCVLLLHECVNVCVSIMERLSVGSLETFLWFSHKRDEGSTSTRQVKEKSFSSSVIK